MSRRDCAAAIGSLSHKARQCTRQHPHLPHTWGDDYGCMGLPEPSTDELLAASAWFIKCAYPPGAKYEVGKRFLFWQARSRLRDAIAAMEGDHDD